MKAPGFLKWVILLLIISNIFRHSHAIQTKPISSPFNLEEFINHIFPWRKQQRKSTETQQSLAVLSTLALVLCFIAASISSAGGIGGGGIFIPILNIVAGLDLKTASTFSAFMVTGGSVANLIYNLSIKNTRFGGKCLIDYDITLLSEPCLLLGVSLGVICNIVFSEWLITALFAVFLAWSTLKTCEAGVLYWKAETDEGRRNGFGESRNGLLRDEICDVSEGEKNRKEPLLDGKREDSMRILWKKMGVLFMIWFSFFVLHLLRGDRDGDHGQSIIPLEPCGVGYWIISASQIPLAIVFTAFILYQKGAQDQIFNDQQEIGTEARSEPLSKLHFPIMALLAGVLGGVFGIGGGMLISPLLLQVGIPPEVTAATCSFMVFFSSSMSAVQYLLLGMEHIDDAFVFAVGCFVASFIGLVVIQSAILKYGRASLIVFSISTVMALSTVLMTSFGAIDIWKDYISGKYMGFKLPC